MILSEAQRQAAVNRLWAERRPRFFRQPSLGMKASHRILVCDPGSRFALTTGGKAEAINISLRPVKNMVAIACLQT